ncbi:MAG: magnesium transporter [Gammaproteobacteria bacterium]|nr:magnesium transporter [Gammaproteobacteria bacterium]
MKPMLDGEETVTSDLPRLVAALERRAPMDAAELLAKWPDETILDAIEGLQPNFALQVIEQLPDETRARLLPQLPEQRVAQWETNLKYPEGSIGRFMEPTVAVLEESTSVADTISQLRDVAQQKLFTYAYCIDDTGSLTGVVVMRDLLFAENNARLRDIMVPDPFAFSPETPVRDAVHDLAARSYPVYPVCDEDGKLLGLVRGYALYEEHAEQLAATPGRMVGVQNEEHVSTPWGRAFRFRHPWLQANLLTAFLAAAVVGVFEDTIAQIVMLAAFLPVLAGQSGNSGCQAMAVTLRGLALDELTEQSPRRMVKKEAWLGFLNGGLVGVVAAGGMLLYASQQADTNAWLLAVIVLAAMTVSCVISGITGVLVPLTLRRLGADPATASSIVLTTATDVVSMGLLLGLATVFLL